MGPLVVGISGPTRAGKGSLLRNLLIYLCPKKATEAKSQTEDNNDASRGVMRFCLPDGGHISVVNQDWYFLRDKIMNELNGNYDSEEAVDHDSMFLAVQTECGIPDMKYVLVEGFLAFHDDRIMQLLDWRLWIDVPRSEVLKRRMKTKFVKKDYFDKEVWPTHERYAALVFEDERQANFGAVTTVDGTQPIKAVFRNVVTLLDLPPREGGMDQRQAPTPAASASPAPNGASSEWSWARKAPPAREGYGGVWKKPRDAEAASVPHQRWQAASWWS